MNYDSLLAGVARPCRYLNGEWNAVHKDHAEAKAKFCLCYPDVYEVGSSNLGLKILYDLLNRHPDFLAERAFAPWGDMEAALRAAGRPLVSLESSLPLRAFDVVGFTLSSELTYTNLLNMLDLGGLPLFAKDRGPDDPLVLAGGAGAGNPEPLADFVDAFFIGEAEAGILEIAGLLAAHPVSQGRDELLHKLAQIPGLYVPALYTAEYNEAGDFARLCPQSGAPATVRARYIDDFDAAPYPTRQIVPYLEVVHDRVTLEIMRGCVRGCRFCQAGMTYRPLRARRIETLRAQAQQALAATGLDEVGLLGFNSPDYPGIEKLVDALIEDHAEDRVGVSVPSSRTDTFTVELAKKLAAVRKPGLTFAPEAGSQRLRDVINKQVAEEDLFAALRAALQSGWQAVKLYFMIGLPTETEADVAAIAALINRCAALGREMLGAKKGRLRITASVGNFVPKPHTPFQWWPQEAAAALEAKQNLLKQEVRGKEIKLSWGDVHASWLEATIARGDRRLGAVLHSAWQQGARFDAWAEAFRPALWQEAMRAAGLAHNLFARREYAFDQPLPWDHISYGVSKEFLCREAQAALQGQTTPDCRSGDCAGCGVCPEKRGAQPRD